MNGFDRLRAVLAGDAPDRIPVSIWFHFGSEHLPPGAVARLHADFWRAYRWDFLKVMFDYRLEMPGAVDADGELDVGRVLAQTDWAAPFERQRACLALLSDELGREVPIVETVYSPFMYLLRHLGHDRKGFLLDHPDVAAVLIGRLTEETCRHIDALRELRVEGIYLATLAGCAAAGSTEFDLQAAADRAVLHRAAGLSRFLHLHGSAARTDHLADYPREVLHRDHHAAGDSGLAPLRAAGERIIMGGLPSEGLTRMSAGAVQAEIAAAIRDAGRTGFILAPGCVVSPSLARGTMLAIRDSSLLAASRP